MSGVFVLESFHSVVTTCETAELVVHSPHDS